MRTPARNAGRRPFVRESVPDSLRRLIEGLNQPAYILGRRWDVLPWNRAADDIFAFSQLPDGERNTLQSAPTRSQSKRLFGDGWADLARRMVAEFRAIHDLWAGDPAFVELLERLRRGCRDFEGWWEAHDIRSGVAGLKLLSHPTKGRMRLEHAAFQSNDDPGRYLTQGMAEVSGDGYILPSSESAWAGAKSCAGIRLEN